MKVRYYWTHDSAGEPCDCETVVLEKEERCYHCDTLIPAGTTCTKLTALDDDVYYFHPKCAEGNLDVLD